MLMNETAITHKNLGNFDEALALYLRAIDAQRAAGDKLGQAIALVNTANLYRTLGQDDRALEFYQRSLALSRELNERRGITINLNNFGDLMLAKGQTGRALEMFGEVLQLTQAMGNRNEQAIAYHNLGDVHTVRGELDQAAKQYDEAIAIQRAIGARGRESRAMLALAEVRLKQGNAAAASELAAQSLGIARETAAPDLEWRALHTGARAARAQGRPADAIAMLQASAAIVNNLRANVSTDTDKIGFVDSRQGVFHDLAGALVAANRIEEGLEAAEAGRARAFADLLAQRQVEGKPAERRQLDAVRSAIDESRTAAPAPVADTRAGTRGGALDERLASLRADHAELASLLTAESATTTEIKATTWRLNATLVEYLVTEKALLAWVVTPQQTIHAATIDVTGPKLQGLVDELRVLLEKDPGSGPPAPRLAELARTLNDLLIRPIAQWLPASAGDQVVIIPHGPLAVLPFAALEDGRARPLVARHTLAFAPAISVFRYTAAKQRPSGAAGAALVVADAAGPSDASMPPLPGAREEGRLVAKRLAPASVSLLVGPDATEAAFKKTAGKTRFVHVATHGLISSDRPLRSSLLLAPGGGDDGYLRVDEIFGLALEADLVVLSGCSTGLGKASGDGIIGLARAFIYAGTPAVVVSQWDVSDRATTYLMDQFYASLGKGRGPAAALRDAQMAARARYPHPALWAAFVAIGEPR
jgi:CHAT domain-containing protein/Tfp pilus assembly protein PilF